MNQSIICLGLILNFAVLAVAQDKADEKPIHVAELNQRPVIGMLGVPLGTATEVDAVVISGRELRRKSLASLYLLKITHVNGKELDEKPTIRFHVPSFVSIELANDSFSLYEMKHGEKTGRLSSAQISDLEKGFVGKSVRLVVYEGGGFVGIPENLPEDVPIWQDTGFHFSTYLNVVAERDKSINRDKKGR